MLTVEGRALGSRRKLFTDFSVPAPPAWLDGPERPTLRSVITHLVHEEVAAFHRRQEERKLIRVLTQRQIDEAATLGKVHSGGDTEDRQPADAESAVATACQAFEDGLFLAIVDGEEVRELDRRLPLRDDSRLAFVRLTLLAGG
jgi:hypothetical protein